MRGYWKVVMISVAACVVLAAAGYTIGGARRNATYGDTPDIVVNMTDGCQEVTAVVPKARFNLLGQAWQDEALHWEDVRIEALAPEREFAHNHEKKGPIAVGDRICGLSGAERYHWIYVPEDKVMAAVVV